MSLWYLLLLENLIAINFSQLLIHFDQMGNGNLWIRHEKLQSSHVYFYLKLLIFRFCMMHFMATQYLFSTTELHLRLYIVNDKNLF